MDGYRFWRQGFWKSHLDGKPYHISALYVVDLALFRQVRPRCGLTRYQDMRHAPYMSG
jgi:hypothetical protein